MSSPWLLGWGNRVKGAIDHNDVDSAKTWFPVRLHLSASCGISSADLSFIFTELGANSLKIAIVPANVAQIDANQLYGEIELWDNGTPKADLWVSKTGWSISDTADTEVYLYFDKDHADNTTYIGIKNSIVAQSVWDGNFVAVWHMDDGADTSGIYDSTSNNQDGTKKAAAEPALTTGGFIANAQDFDGSDDYINGGAPPAGIQGSNPRTITVWVKTDDSAAYDFIIHWGAPDNGNNGEKMGLRGDTGDLRVEVNGGGHTSSLAIGDGADHFVACTFPVGGTTLADFDLFVDNVKEDATGTRAINTSGENINIGRVTVGGHYWEGNLDEIRISDVDRGADWLKAEYESQRDHLITWGINEFYVPRHGFTNFQVPGIV